MVLSKTLSVPAKQLKVIVYARFSTEDQNPRSTEAQLAVVRKQLPDFGLEGTEIAFRKDEGISGEILSRPGINEVRIMIQSGEYDAVIAEDTARFFRDRAEPQKFAGLCLDQGCRFIAINDDVDTDNPHWEQRLHRAVDKAKSSNEDTAARIHRATDDRWENGFAMGPLLPGYTRTRLSPSINQRTIRGPFRDQRDDKWTPVVLEIYERIAGGELPRNVAIYATREKLPRVENAKKVEHDDRSILALIRNPIYKGLEEFGKTFSDKHYGSGRHIPKRNVPEKVRFRPMPHLAHVPESVWQRANDAISKRNHARVHPSGSSSPLFRIPRNSRLLLSNHGVCDRCRGKLTGVGRDGGGYRCAAALRGDCWVRATVHRDLAEKAIFQAVADALLVDPNTQAALVDSVNKFAGERGQIGERIRELRLAINDAGNEINRLVAAIAKAPDLEDLFVEKIRDRKNYSVKIEHELAGLEADSKFKIRTFEPAEILDLAKAAAGELLMHNVDAGVKLRQLTGAIHFVPFKRVDCDLIVLRARFSVHYVRLLQKSLPYSMRGAPEQSLEDGLSKSVIVDLFERPKFVRLAREAGILREMGHRAEDISEKLCADRKTVFDGLRLDRLMREKGLADPYVEVLECPPKASRWGRRRKSSSLLPEQVA